MVTVLRVCAKPPLLLLMKFWNSGYVQVFPAKIADAAFALLTGQ